jgi:hypothetical protein
MTTVAPRVAGIAPTRLLAVTIRTAVLSSGLLAGSLVAVLLADLALRGNPIAYIAFHQATTVLYTATLPAIGAVTSIAIVISLVRGHDAAIRKLLAIALACGIAGMLITVLIHFPLNATIQAWPTGVIPIDFASVATRWDVAHLARTVFTGTSFVLAASALARTTASS